MYRPVASLLQHTARIKWRRLSVVRGADHMLSEKSQWTQNGTMLVDLDWPLNASSPLSASAELLVSLRYVTTCTACTLAGCGTCRSWSCTSDMSPDNSKHRMISCSRSAWRNLLTGNVGIFSRHSPVYSNDSSNCRIWQANITSLSTLGWFVKPRVGSGVVRIDLLGFLAGCRKRRLNQALSVLSLSLGSFWCTRCAVI